MMTQIKRVFYVGSPPLFTKGASAVHIMKMCSAMSRMGIEVTLLIPYKQSDIDIYEYYGVGQDFEIVKFRYFDNASLRNIYHGITCSIYTKRNRQKFDLVITRNIVYTYLSTMYFNIPTVYDAHHPLVKGASFMFRAFKDSEHLVRFSTNSKGLGQIYVNEGLSEDKLMVAPNGVDLEAYTELPPKTDARNRVGLPQDKTIVCYSGNIYAGRGIELIIDTASRLPQALFVIVGGLDTDIDRYTRLVDSKGLNNVWFIGFVPHADVPTYLSAADVLVMPYTSQMTIKDGTRATDFTSPIKLFEYMAAARPIVATGIPSVLEILTDGENAIVVEPDSSEAFAEGVESAINNSTLAEEVGKKAGEDARRYTWEARAKRLLGIK